MPLNSVTDIFPHPSCYPYLYITDSNYQKKKIAFKSVCIGPQSLNKHFCDQGTVTKEGSDPEMIQSQSVCRGEGRSDAQDKCARACGGRVSSQGRLVTEISKCSTQRWARKWHWAASLIQKQRLRERRPGPGPGTEGRDERKMTVSESEGLGVKQESKRLQSESNWSLEA